MTRLTSPRRTLLGALGIGTLLLFATACGGDDEPTLATASPEAHNQADVTFAQMMIPHHQEAIEMADLAPSRAASEEVKALAQRIKDAQDPEIQTMTAWLEEWDEAVTDTGMGGMDMGGDAGAMSEEDMTALENATDASFDRLFLELMIEHHEGAIEMARTEVGSGQFAPAKRLARAIIAAQEAEIEEMQKLLADDS